MAETFLVVLVQLQTLADVAAGNRRMDAVGGGGFREEGGWLRRLRSPERLVVVPEAVVQHAELQEGGAVVIAQPRGRGQVLDGLLRVPHAHVAFRTKLPRVWIPGRDLEKQQNVTHSPAKVLNLNTFWGFLFFRVLQTDADLDDSLQDVDGGAVVPLVVRSVRLLLQLLQLVRLHQLLLRFLVARRALQLKEPGERSDP